VAERRLYWMEFQLELPRGGKDAVGDYAAGNVLQCWTPTFSILPASRYRP
jgi:hypothetical protein